MRNTGHALRHCQNETHTFSLLMDDVKKNVPAATAGAGNSGGNVSINDVILDEPPPPYDSVVSAKERSKQEALMYRRPSYDKSVYSDSGKDSGESTECCNCDGCCRDFCTLDCCCRYLMSTLCMGM